MTEFDWWKRAQHCISQGALTNSKHPESLILGAYPTHVTHGHGSYLYDQAGNKYIDFICGLGANFFGYGNDKINQKIMHKLYGGYSHSLPTTQEVITAEKLKEIFFFVDQWKFLKTGSDACSAALKFARNATGRKNVLTDGYHGHGEQFVYLTPPAYGVVPQNYMSKFKNLDQIDETTAAVIIEPVITDYSPERMEYLKALRKKCDETGALLIFDEVITGFRFKKFSVANYSGVTPDLICIGKAMANGMALSAVGGKKHIMEDRKPFISSTYAGEVLSLAACETVCDLLQRSNDYNIDILWEKAEEFIHKFNGQCSTVKMEGYPTRGILKGDDKEVAIFMGEMAQVGYLFHKSYFINFGHLDILDMALDESRIVKEKIEDGLGLKYPMPKSPFSQEVRDGKR